MESQELLTVDELAQRLKVPPSWVYGYSRRRGPDSIPKIKVGKYLRFELREVKNWLEKKGAERDLQ